MPISSSSIKKQETAFFGRRKGRPLRHQQQDLFENWLPQLEINLSEKPPACLHELFQCPVKKIHLEIGFGGGEHLFHALNHHPDTGFIGVEPFINGMSKFLSQLNQSPDLQHRLRLYADDGLHLLDWLPSHSLSGIDLFYPDPWPKKRHWKRRFVNQTNLNRFARVLKTGGVFRFASDIESYVNWTLEQCETHGCFKWDAQSADDWHNPFTPWISTRYENKALVAGRRPAYLQFLYQKIEEKLEV